MKKQRSRKKSGRARLTQLFQQDALDEQRFLAADAFRFGDLEACERAARKALRIRAGDRDATVLLCQVLTITDRRAEVPGLLRDAIHEHPNDPLLSMHLAEAALGTGRLREARSALKKFLLLMDRNRPAARGIRGKLLSRAKYLSREIERASGKSESPGRPGRRVPGGSRSRRRQRPTGKMCGRDRSSRGRPARIGTPHTADATPESARPLLKAVPASARR